MLPFHAKQSSVLSGHARGLVTVNKTCFRASKNKLASSDLHCSTNLNALILTNFVGKFLGHGSLFWGVFCSGKEERESAVAGRDREGGTAT